MRPLIVCVFLLLWIVPQAASVQNPFLNKDAKETDSPVKGLSNKTKTWVPRFAKPLLELTNRWQKGLKSRMTAMARDIQEKPFSTSLLGFWMLAFLYGIVHALGPGHGKMIVISYFISRPGKTIHGILMGNLLTFVHVGSAVAVVMGVYWILHSKNLADFEKVSPTLEKVSYSLVSGIGITMLIQTLRKLFQVKPERNEVTTEKTNLPTLIATSIVTGIVPCPGAAIILIFSIILGIIVPGLVAMIFLALGMGITTTLFAVAAITSRNTVFRLTKKRKRSVRFIQAGASLLGALLIVFLGGLLFLSV